MTEQNMGPGRVLIVEDDQDIRDLMASQLRSDGHQVETEDNGSQAIAHIQGGRPYDLFVLDWMLPGLSGVEICQHLRQHEHHHTPILMVTAMTKTEDIVHGLENEADDYITKPFDLDEFKARVRALLRRRPGEAKSGHLLEFGPLQVDLGRVKVWVSEQEINLTQSEFKILTELMRNGGNVFTRGQLYQKVQGPNIHASDRTIDTHVAGLRKKLGAGAAVIETIRGVGYRFNFDAKT